MGAHQISYFAACSARSCDRLRDVEWVHIACSCFPLFKGKCSCHMQNLVFLCNLDNLLQNKVIKCFFFFLKSNFKMALI